jgi:hypothetical protein
MKIFGTNEHLRYLHCGAPLPIFKIPAPPKGGIACKKYAALNVINF